MKSWRPKNDNYISPKGIAFPIGMVIITVTNINPTNWTYGTWKEFGQGRVLVGLDSSQTEFNTELKTGGSKYTEKHSHIISNKYGNVNTGSNWASISSYDNAQAPATGNTVTQEFGTGNAGNLQPYIVVHFWRRVS